MFLLIVANISKFFYFFFSKICSLFSCESKLYLNFQMDHSVIETGFFGKNLLNIFLNTNTLKHSYFFLL
jgi:hypothetical protein